MKAVTSFSIGKSILLAVAMILLTTPVEADVHKYQPLMVDWEIAQADREGSVNLTPGAGFDIAVIIKLKNRDERNGAIVKFPTCPRDREPAGVLISELNRGVEGAGNTARRAAAAPTAYVPAWQACFPGLYALTHTIFLLPRGEASVEVAIDFRKAGRIQVLFFARVFMVNPELFSQSRPPAKPNELEELVQSDVLAAILPIDLYFNVDSETGGQQGRFRRSNYIDLFVPTLPTPEAGVGTRDILEVLDDTPLVIEEYLNCRPRPMEEYNIERSMALVRQIPTESGLGNKLPCPEEQPNPCTHPGRLTAAREQLRGSAVDPTFTLQGHFSVKWTDHALHPAFGWRVRAWWNSSGTWRNMAEDWIQWDGNWRLVFSSPGYTGQHLRVQYIAFNRYFTPQAGNGDTYRWIGPDRNNVPQNHNEGAWLADCDGGALRGLGEVYNEGMVMWSRLYWDGGIDPLRSTSMKLFFPNTTNDCGDGSGNPWSCAYLDGRVYLIAAHALGNGVVQHEFGHQLNYQFWSNKRPASSGGSHSMGSCYTPGLALLEGFADFIPFWVQQQDRGAFPSSVIMGGFNIESPTACQDDTNEAWVAATFWDLHDSRSDGLDILWFNHVGAVIAIYLNNPVASDGGARSMSDYRTIYRNAASSGHQIYIDRIFQQDHTN